VNLASFLAAEEQLEEAIEFAGRALVIHIQRFGILTSKTAESHFQLGSLFFHTDDFLGSEREITTAKSIDSKLFNECSIVVSGCEILLAQIAIKHQQYTMGYLRFERAYRIRRELLGDDANLSRLAL
jgi:hypothetical protein